jgi:hypothetical protein
MKTRLPLPRAASAALLLAPLLLTASARAEDNSVHLPAYEVTAPKFTSGFAEFMQKLDTLFDAPWVDARGSPLIQAIVWRHGFLSEHPSDEAIIYVNQKDDGAVTRATTIYTSNGKLYANSYALGERMRLSGLTAADIHDRKKIESAIDGIHEAFALSAELETASIRGLGELAYSPAGSFGSRGIFRSNILSPSGERFGRNTSRFNPYLETVYTSGDGDTGQIVPTGLNPFYPGFLDPSGGTGDRYHEPPAAMLDSVYRALHDPSRAGLIPVALSPVSYQFQSKQGTRARTIQALVFDWEGVHYVYRPYSGTVGHAIPRNPVTGLPYLCVKDDGLIESIYFSATYLKTHPQEKAVPVASESPFAAYTVNGKLCLFSPSLNHFAELKAVDVGTIANPNALASSLARMRAQLAAQPAPSARAGVRHPSRLPERLTGDTTDSQMRRIFVAFQDAGVPNVHLTSGETSTLTFSWQGVNYVYGSDQQLRQAPNG